MGPSEPLKEAGVVEEPIIVKKGWGYEKWLVNNTGYCGKLMHVDKGKKCSMHGHPIKHETFFIKSGKILMHYITRASVNARQASSAKAMATSIRRVISDRPRNLETMGHKAVLEPGTTFNIPPGVFHQFTALEESEIIEFSTPHDDDDVIRISKGDCL